MMPRRSSPLALSGLLPVREPLAARSAVMLAS